MLCSPQIRDHCVFVEQTSGRPESAAVFFIQILLPSQASWALRSGLFLGCILLRFPGCCGPTRIHKKQTC